jgi:hypothetical protein
MKWIISLLLFYFVGMLLNGLIELDYTGGSEGVLLNFFTAVETIDISWNLFTTAASIVSAGSAIIIVFWSMLTFDYAFFQGGYVLIRIVFCIIPIAYFIVVVIRKFGAEPQ